eukprot:3918904-Prymnesium_polylepis.1
MPFSPRTAHGCNPRCVYPHQRPRGLERPCLSGWLKTEYPYAGHGLFHSGGACAKTAPASTMRQTW